MAGIQTTYYHNHSDKERETQIKESFQTEGISVSATLLKFSKDVDFYLQKEFDMTWLQFLDVAGVTCTDVEQASIDKVLPETFVNDTMEQDRATRMQYLFANISKKLPPAP